MHKEYKEGFGDQVSCTLYAILAGSVLGWSAGGVLLASGEMQVHSTTRNALGFWSGLSPRRPPENDGRRDTKQGSAGQEEVGPSRVFVFGEPATAGPTDFGCLL